MGTFLKIWALSLLQFGGTLGIMVNNSLGPSHPGLGETITLNCSIADGTASDVVWWKDKHDRTAAEVITYNCELAAQSGNWSSVNDSINDPGNDYNSRLTNIQCDGENYNFQLSNVQISDGGDWVCEADGQEATTTLRLNVLVPPTTPTVTNPSPVKVGDTAKFTCDAENVNVTKPVTYTWTKNGSTVSPGIIQTGALFFSSVTKETAGKYVCVAKNEAGSATSTEQDFVVYYEPDSLQLKTSTPSYTKSENEEEIFTCEAIGGNPVPSVALIRQQATTKETLIQKNSSDLIFRRIMTRQDNQVKFYCEATGPGISDQMMSTMIIYNVLFPHNVQVKLSKTTVNEHELVRFECDASGGNPDLVTRYQWLWKKKSGSTTEHVIKDTETGTQNGKLLEFVRIPYDKSGTYSCKAWNSAGMGQASTELNIQYSPRIHPEFETKYKVVGEIGKEATLKLLIIANPNPPTTGFVWSKDGYILSNSSKNYEVNSWATSSKLTIKNVKPSDFTFYSCSVKTSGFQAKVFKFKLVKAAYDVTVVAGCVVGAVAVAITCISVAIMLWQRRVAQRKKKRRCRPPIDTNDYDDRRVESQVTGNDIVPTYANIGSRTRTLDRLPAQPRLTVHQEPAHLVLGNDPTSDDDLDAYDYVDGPNAMQQSASSQNQASIYQANETDREDSSPNEKMQRRHRSEGTCNMHKDLSIITLVVPDVDTTESDSSQTDGACGPAPHCSGENGDQGQESSYERLEPVATVMNKDHGRYLDFRELNPGPQTPM